MKLKTKIIFSVIIIFLLIDFCFTYIFVNNTRHNLLDKLNTKIENTTSLINQVNSAPLYDIDINSLENNLKSFLNDEDIQAIKLEELNGSISLSVGNFNIDKKHIIKKDSTIEYNDEVIGNITTYYSTKKIDDNMKEYINENILLSLVAAIAVSLMLYYLLQKLVNPITNLTKVASNITSGNLDEHIEIINNDEVGDLAKQFEIMRTSLKKRIDTINDQNKEIKFFNDKLEIEIDNRTKELMEQKDELESMVETLKITQDKLIEAEKMSSLGVLVAGIAHEVNTPIGIGLTGVTHFLEITKKLNIQYEDDNMSQEEFEEYLRTSTEIANLINSNLHKTAQLIKNFKQISFDQSSEEKRTFNLKEYIEEILFSIHNITRKTNIKIINTCDEDTDIHSYPGAISQVMTNLIINSIRHGFEEKQNGIITINAEKQEQVIKLIYTDNGRGIPKENLPKIFDPFFTTNREKGGTGLGLNILYNIVSTTLHGTIKCISEENQGVKFIILFQENEENDKIEKEILWQI